MTPAEVLAAAADKLDALAGNDLTPGPWTVEFECPEGEHHHDWDEVWIAGHRRSTVAGLNERYTAAPRDAAYIAAMNPLVGKALADLLRAHAEVAATLEQMLTPEGPPTGHVYELARLIIGGES